MSDAPLHLFEGFGVELEYAIVDADTLAVKPVCDELLKAVAGRLTDNVDFPDGVTWSNELALHVVELKATRPLPRLDGWAETFQRHVRKANETLAPLGGRLMPTAMHPWMNPATEMRLWPHEYNEVYEAFHRIFDCRGHGWANLQSAHLNLPFHGDEEFGRLHAAVRLLLPIMPALSASSPIVEGRLTGMMDTRLDVYRTNSRRIPSVAGSIVPEPVWTRADYEETILGRMYADVAPFDPGGVLRDEFLNARGAIARFSRGAIEIRVLDVQEHPLADFAVLGLIVETLRGLVEERWSSSEMQRRFPTDRLHALLLRTIRDADAALVDDAEYLSLFGLPSSRTVGEMWREMPRPVGELGDAAEKLLERGCLARRIASCRDPRAAYRELCSCLQEDRGFVGERP